MINDIKEKTDSEVLLRDWDEGSLECAENLAKTLNIEKVCCVKKDAFDKESYTEDSSAYDIAIVSGLYELLPDNEPVLESLRGIAIALGEAGYLIYTGQPWHPEVEMIARTLNNRNGDPWIMRRRSQAEMDRLVKEAGFQKIRTLCDQWGIFTVSLARKEKHV